MGSYDVVIAGGGIIGSAVAYFLTARADFNGSVAVIERDPTYNTASAPRSLGGIRQQFTTPENIAISRFGLEFLDTAADVLAVEGECPDIGFKRHGYLFLGDTTNADALRQANAVQRSAGAAIDLLDTAGIARHFPYLNTDGLTLASYGGAGEGWIDPFGLLQAFRKKAQSQGAVYIEDTVTSIGRSGNRIIDVGLAGGERISCGMLVNAAGFRGGAVAAMAGLPLPVEARKRMVFVVDTRRPMPETPLTIDPTGVYWRPEGPYFLCGLSPEADNDPAPDIDDLEVDHSWFEERIWPVMANRAPMFEALKVINAWGGHYDMNLFDHNAIVGPMAPVENMIFANGFSGHGVQQSPAVGRAVAELIASGRFETLDLACFTPDRIAEGRHFLELAVV